MSYAYLDVSSNVVALSQVSRTLTEAQAKNPDVVSVVVGAPVGLSAMGGRDPQYHTKTSGDGTDISHYTATLQLRERKKTRVVLIDRKTDWLIAQGFVVGVKRFSLTMYAQMKMTAAHQVKDDPALVYPIRWNTIDDRDSHDIANATALNTFYMTGFNMVRGHLDSGTVFKDAIRAATSVAELDAVVDDR